jgi:hypothetical protein
MKNIKHLHFLLALVLLASVAWAQARDSSMENSVAENDSVSAARSQYTQAAENSPAADGTILARLRRRGPDRPLPSHRGYPLGTYQTPWMQHGNAAHAVIGAAIGFGIGAALGATHSERNGTPVAGGVIIGGGLLGFIGGTVGACHGGPYLFTHRRRVYRPTEPEDDKEADLHPDARSKTDQAQQSVSAPPASDGQPVVAGVKAEPTSDIPAVVGESWRSQEPQLPLPASQ